MAECTLDSCNLFLIALRYSKTNAIKASLADLVRIEEGLAQEDFIHVGVRLINWTFQLKLTVMLAMIVSGQIPSLLCICLLFIFCLVTSIHFCRMICKYSVFQSKLVATYRIFLEASLLLFYCSCLVERATFLTSHRLEFQSLVVYIDGIVLFCMLLCLLLQVITNLIELGRFVSKLCRKQQTSPADLRHKIKTTKFASVYIEATDQLRTHRRIQKASIQPKLNQHHSKKKVTLKQLLDKKEKVAEDTPQSSRVLLSKRDEALPPSEAIVPKNDKEVTKTVLSEHRQRSEQTLTGIETKTQSQPSTTTLKFANPVLAALRHKAEHNPEAFQQRTPKRKIKITGFTKAPKASLPSIEILDTELNFPFSIPRLDRRLQDGPLSTPIAERKRLPSLTKFKNSFGLLTGEPKHSPSPKVTS